ncbi:Phosphatidate cytidylyltransferase [Posidoniimonas corsicana]|uniref:Phosphatidate cytidylyltransferase n=1 Tax=Posidoniimonas corsicana TaxID=1938618 RepID=A0A5C5UT74_9BACT|nr:phosphatidate cytidylyltransferase [Posidoniimonas corsicana]TWT29594.1 Phosphatidate cytidylyltransferase [Posidoniimonas corsicana]
MLFSELPVEVNWTLAAVFACLVFASAVTVTLAKLKPDKDSAELRDRVRTWWMIVVLFAATLWMGYAFAIFFFAFVSYLAFKELLSLIPTRRADRRVLFWAYLVIPAQYAMVYLDWYGVVIVFIPVYIFLFLPVRMLMIGETEGYLRAYGTLHWGLMTTVFCLSHAALLLMFQPRDVTRLEPAWPSEAGALHPGAGLLVFLVLMTEVNDIAQFLWGKSLGRRKIAPKVSPGKTVVGFVGGAATTAALAMLLGPAITLFTWQTAAGAGLIIGVAGFVGDLAISMLKRDLGVKDSGSTLPGHGGVLDRIDSLIYTAPLIFHYVFFLY